MKHSFPVGKDFQKQQHNGLSYNVSTINLITYNVGTINLIIIMYNVLFPVYNTAEFIVQKEIEKHYLYHDIQKQIHLICSYIL